MTIPVTRHEIERLISNQRAILQAIPEPVMVINGIQDIEFMNRSAVSFFNKFKYITENCTADLNTIRRRFLSSIKTSQTEKTNQLTKFTDFENHHFEYVLAPFHGYQGDGLQWLIMRDITNQKKYEDELSLFHSNVELILKQKIKKLKESKKIRKKLADQLIYLKSQIPDFTADDSMIGSSRPMRDLRDMVTQVAKSDATILITGESGTGKELVANLIRETSNRENKPFLKINCNTITDSLLESDLFGYEKGAFTDAHTRTKGKFEVVNGGTIFLDEIGDISPRMQAALLRVLQDGEIIRVGGNAPININVRIVAATNRDLSLAIKDGTFRLDLYYRLNVINISIPPLRQRMEDIEDLVSYFIRKYRLAFNKDIDYIPRPIIDKLIQHNWPGNVRELENVIQRAVLMAKSSIITEEDIFFDIAPEKDTHEQHISLVKKSSGMPLKAILKDVEKEVIVETLKRHRGNAANAAKELAIGKTAFYDKLKRFNITSKDFR